MQGKNIEGLMEHCKKRKDDCTERINKALNQMLRDGEKINKTRVAERAGVSLNFLYSNPDIMKTVEKYCSESRAKRLKTQDSKDVLINCLRAENRELKSRLKKEEANDKYKARIEELELEVARLNKELQKAYSASLSLEY